MRTTDGATTLPTNSQASRSPGRSGDERGVIALEWLLIVGAVAGLAAMSVLTVQRVVDDTAEAPVDPHVRLLEAEIASAFLAAEANAAVLSQPTNIDDYTIEIDNNINADFKRRCQDALPAAFRDVVEKAVWAGPGAYLTRDLFDPVVVLAKALDPPARCAVTPLPVLVG